MKAIRSDLFKRCDHGRANWLTPACRACSWYTKFHWNGKAYPHIGLDAYLKRVPDPRWPDGHVATLVDAETLADIIKTAIRDNRFGQRPAAAAPDAPPAVTFAALVALFARYREASEDVSWTNEPGMMGQIAALDIAVVRSTIPGDLDPAVRTVGDLAIDRVTEATVLTAFGTTKGLAVGTRKKYRVAFGWLFRFAVKERATTGLSVSPLTEATEWPDLGRSNVRMARLTRAIVDRLKDAATAHSARFEGQRLSDMIETAAVCGPRHGEMLAIKVDDVVFDPANPNDDPYVDVTATEQGGRKTDKPRQLPLTDPTVVAIFRRRCFDPATGDRRPGHWYVFGDEDGGRIRSVEKAWKTAIAYAFGITPGWTDGGDFDATTRRKLKAINGGAGVWWTDLRHFAALTWDAAGVSLYVIADLLGDNPDMLAVYLKRNNRDARKEYARAMGHGAPPPLAPTAVATASNRKRPQTTAGPLATNPADRSKPIQTGKSFRLVQGRKTG